MKPLMKWCPQCRLLLEQIAWRDDSLVVCRSCGGSWLNVQTFRRVLENDPSALGELNRDYPGVASAGMFEGLALNCPDCETARLELQPIPKRSECAVLICPSCGGAWLRPADRAALGEPSAPAPENVMTPPVVTQEPEKPPSRTIPITTESAAPVIVPIRSEETDAEKVLRELLEGNQRYVESRAIHPNQSATRRVEVAQAQKPRAIVVGCADSRVPPEIVFDQGLGDLFVVRNAGNVVEGTLELGVEYAVERFDVPLIVVLGHTRCSAVKAATLGEATHPYVEEMAKAIRPAVERARAWPGDLLDNAVKAHVQLVVEDLRNLQPVLAPRVQKGRLRIVPAVYDLDNGRVEVLPEEEEIPPAPPQTVPNTEPVVTDTSAPPASGLHTLTADTLAMLAREGNVCCCPRCLTVYEAQTRMCPNCRVGLVRPDATFSCPRCRVPNSFVNECCRTCGAALRTPEIFDRLYPVWESVPEVERKEPVKMAISATKTTTSIQEKPRATRWCPRCRRGFSGGIRFCTRCGVPLVEAGILVRCLRCGTENVISAERCRRCDTTLHPDEDEEATSGDISPILTSVDWREVVRPSSPRSGSSCSTQVLVVGGVVVLAFLLF